MPPRHPRETGHGSASDTLKDIEACYSMITDQIDNSLWLMDMAFNVTWVSRSVERNRGYSLEELRTLPLQKLLAPASFELVLKTISDQLTPERLVQKNLNISQTMDLEFCRKDGSTYANQVTLKLIRDKEGSPAGILGIGRDMELEHMNKALQESLKKYRAIFDESVAAIFILDAEAHFIDSNNAGSDLLGYSREELLRMRMPDVAADPGPALPPYQQLLSGGRLVNHEHNLRRQDGTVITVLNNSRPLTDQQGNVVGMLSTLVDITERKESDKEVRRLTSFLDSIVENIPSMVFVKDATDLRFVRINRTAEELLGYSRKDLMGRNDYDFFPEDMADFTTTEDRDVLRAGKIVDIPEEPVQTLHKGIRTLHTKKVPIHGAHGEPAYLLGISEDVTERKQAEDALRASEDKYRKLVENTTDLIFTLNSRGEFIFLSPAVTNMLGYDVDALLDCPFQMIIHPDDVQACEKVLKERLKGNIIHPGFAYRVRTAAGEWRWHSTNGDAIRNDKGELLYFQGVAKDITALKLAEEKLRTNQRILKLFVENAPAAIAMLDRDMRYLAFSNRFATDYRVSDRNIIGRTHYDIFPEIPERWRIIHRRCLAGETMKADDDPFPREDGSLDWVRWEIHPWHEESGEIGGILLFSELRTEQKQAEEEKTRLQEQLLQAQKMESIGRLAGGVAHDFNNMLGVILGHTGMALDDPNLDKQLRNDLEEIRKAGERSADLTRQLLAFARRQTVSPKVLDLNEAVEGALKMLRRLIGEDINLLWMPGHHLRQIHIDASQVDQVLANLCVNARDAISGVGKVTIETENVLLDDAYSRNHLEAVPGEHVMLAVSDNGSGMDKETIGKLFEPFFTTKEVGKGTGLGLATVYGIMKQNNGFIDVYSELNRGTTFKLYFPPYAGKPEKAKNEETPVSIPGGRETILVVEDEPAILEMTKRMLEKQGYEILTARTPGEAIILAQTCPGTIHLLITDVVMPEMNGHDLAVQLVSFHPQIRKLFMSGYTSDIIALHGVLDEGVHFIQKPFSLKDLAAKVRKAMDT